MINRRPISIGVPLHPLLSALITSCVLLGNLIVSIDAFSLTQFLHHRGSQRTPSATILQSKKNLDEASVERVRAAVFQAPAKSDERSQNPLEILTEAADSLRVASMHGVDVVIFPELYLSGGPKQGSKRAMDREGSELNVVGNMCEKLNVACMMGYAETVHESESKTGNDPDGERGDAYNSIAAFHADGSRAGNYRCVSVRDDGDDFFRRGHPVVEFIPTLLQLPNGNTPSREGQREIKVGMVCGSDVLCPENCRHLVRSGAQAIIASTSFKNNDPDLRIVRCAIPCRAMENRVPFLFANYVEARSEKIDFGGSSAILSRDGNYLVCGPLEEDGDMPSDCGYLIPCKVGTLYAADIDINLSSPGAQATGDDSTLQKSIEQWDLTPRMPCDVGTSLGRHNRRRREMNGFGQDSKKKGTTKKMLK